MIFVRFSCLRFYPEFSTEIFISIPILANLMNVLSRFVVLHKIIPNWKQESTYFHIPCQTFVFIFEASVAYKTRHIKNDGQPQYNEISLDTMITKYTRDTYRNISERIQQLRRNHYYQTNN